MKYVRGGSGLGDSIYLRPIVEYFVKKGDSVTALSNYPDVFIGSGANVEPFRRDRVNVVAHYTSGKSDTTTTQFQDMCNCAKTPPLAMSFNWKTKNKKLLARLNEQAMGRKMIVAHGGRAPMGRTDGFGIELLPNESAFDLVLSELKDCFIVTIGGNDGKKYDLSSELDLTGQTSVSDMLDIIKASDGVVAQCSFAIPMAECLGVPFLGIWAERGMRSAQGYIKTITPKKVLSKASSRFVVDDWDADRIREEVAKFYQVTFQ